MPPIKSRPKDDTWNTEELTQALKGQRGDSDKKRRSRGNDDNKEQRRHGDELNGSSVHRRNKDDGKRSHRRDEEGHMGKSHSRGDFSPEPRVDLTEVERERLRQERREKRASDSRKKEERPRKEEKLVDSDDADVRRRLKREDITRRYDSKSEGDRHQHYGDKDIEHKRHRDKDARHRDKDDEGLRYPEDVEREQRRLERRERKDVKDGMSKRDQDSKSKRNRDHDEDRREKHLKKDQHGDRDKRHREQEERHKDRDRGEKHRDRGSHPDRDRDGREERKKKEQEREKKERLENEKSRTQEKGKIEAQKKIKEEETAEGKGDYYDEYEDDFEDYEDDFEDDSELNEGGEMNEILRALDEENARLTSQSQHSNYSDLTQLSDERFREKEEPAHDQHRHEDTRRTFINFVSAKQRVMNQSIASKARRRADDLRKMIELDTVYYDMFDLPPVKEYDLYIRSFGRSNTKQAYVQTNEDAQERDIQTDDVEDHDKWTQIPAEDMPEVGGDGITVIAGSDEKTIASNPETFMRIGKFLERAAQVMNVLLEEENAEDLEGGQTREKTSSISLSQGFSQLGCPSFLAGRYVQRASFCHLQPSVFLTLHSKPQEPSVQNPLDSYGLICVWNVKEIMSPQKVLTCMCQPTCACFSPSRAALVIAGMHDGSVVVWDLREPSSHHRSVNSHGQEITLRFPTYNTAGVLEKENHHSPVTSIVAVYPTIIRKDPEDNSSSEYEGSLSFQLASVEENATVNLWVVTEISSPDMAGSEVDLGLAPGGRVKLLRSSTIDLNKPNKLNSTGTLKAQDIHLNPSDLNHFFVATDLGQIIHGVQFGSRVFPRTYQPEIDSPKKITCLDFSPFGEPYFLAGCEDGSVYLYHTSHKHPLSSWPAVCGDHCVLAVQWSHSRPAVFFVLADDSRLYTFDLIETGLAPVQADDITSGRATALVVGSDPALIGRNKIQHANVLLAMQNGTTELHIVSPVLRQQQTLEMEFLTRYLERF